MCGICMYFSYNLYYMFFVFKSFEYQIELLIIKVYRYYIYICYFYELNVIEGGSKLFVVVIGL